MSTSYCALNPGVSPGARTPRISSSDISAWSSRIFLIPTSSFTQAVVFFLYKLQRGLRLRVMAWIFKPAVVGDATDGHLMAVVPIRRILFLNNSTIKDASLSANLMLPYYKMSREQELKLIFLLVLNIWRGAIKSKIAVFVLITYLRASTFS